MTVDTTVNTTTRTRAIKMAATPESKVKIFIKKSILTIWPDAYVYMPVPFGYGKKGVADFLWCINGVFVSIEAKAKGGKETKLQKFDGDDVIKSGGIRMLIEGNDEAAIQWLQTVMKLIRTEGLQSVSVTRYKTP